MGQTQGQRQAGRVSAAPVERALGKWPIRDIGEMGQSFLDKHGFLSAYKNTTFTYLLAPCLGSWEQMEGGTKERPRGHGRDSPG